MGMLKTFYLTRPTPGRAETRPFPGLRSRLEIILNVALRATPCGCFSAAALLNGLFEHPDSHLVDKEGG